VLKNKEGLIIMTTPTSNVKSNEEMLAKSTIENDDTPELKLPFWQANMWLFVLWAMHLIDVMDRYALSATLPMIKQAYQLTDAQAGMLGSIFGVSIVIFVIPTGMIAYKWSRRKVCAIMVALWSIATWGTGLAKGYFPLLAARFGVGVGEAGYIPVAYSLISAWYPKSKRGTMMGWFYSGSQVGATVGLMVAGWLAYTYGWKACFGIMAVPGLILAAIGWFMPDFKNKIDTTVKEVEQAGSTKKSLNLGLKDAFIYTVKSPAVLCSFLITGCLMLGTTSMSIWGITLFTRTFGMNVKQASTFVGFIGIIAVTVPILMGWVSDRLQIKNKEGRLTASFLFVTGFLLSIIIFTQNSLYAKSLVVAFIFFGLAKAFVISGMSNINSVTQDLLPPFYRSVSSTFIPVANQGIGGVAGPVLCGVLSDACGINMALAYVSTIAFILVMVLTMLCKKFYKKDREKLESLGSFNLERG